MAVRIGKILFTEDDIQRRVAELGEEISRDYADRTPVLVSVLKGGIIFMADLVRELKMLHEIDFMSVSSYNGGTESSGVVRILQDLSINIEGEDVIIVALLSTTSGRFFWPDTRRPCEYVRCLIRNRKGRSRSPSIISALKFRMSS